MLKYPILIILILLSLQSPAQNWQDSSSLYLNSIKNNLPSTDSIQFLTAEKAEQFAQKSGNDSLLCMSWYLRGVLYYYKGYHQASNSYYFKALHSPEAVNEPNLQYRLLNNIGINYDMLGEYNKSLSYYQKALEIEQKTENTEGMAQVRINIGRLYRVTKDYKKSHKNLMLALEYYKKNPNDYYLGLIYQNLNSLYIDSFSDKNEITSSFKQALYFYEKIGYSRGLTELFHNQGDYFRNTGQIDSVYIYIEKALNFNEKHKTHDNNAQLLLDLANLHYNKGALIKALQYAHESYQSAEEKKQIHQQINALQKIAEIGLKNNDTRTVFDALSRINILQDSLFREDKTQAFAEMSILYDVKEKNNKIEKQELVIKNQRIRESLLWLVSIFLGISLISVLLFLRFRHNKLRQLYQKNIELLEEHEKNLHYRLSDNITTIIKEGQSEEENLFNRLQSILEEEKLFTNSRLQINDLAERLSSNQKYISRTINQNFGSNFNDYLNSYRVDEAKKLILAHKHLSVDQIMHNCGFRSRSTFAAAFKKFSGMTPGEFRKIADE